MSSLLERLGANVIALMKAKRLSYRQLSKSTGIAFAHLHRMVSGGQHDPSTATIERLAAALEVDPLDLLREPVRFDVWST